MGIRKEHGINRELQNIEATKRTTIVSDNAQWFEDNSPIEDRFKKEEVKAFQQR